MQWPRPLSKGVMPIRGEAECGAGHNAHLGTCAAVAVGDRVVNGVDAWIGTVGHPSLVLSMRQSKRLSSMEASTADLPISLPATIWQEALVNLRSVPLATRRCIQTSNESPQESLQRAGHGSETSPETPRSDLPPFQPNQAPAQHLSAGSGMEPQLWGGASRRRRVSLSSAIFATIRTKHPRATPYNEFQQPLPDRLSRRVTAPPVIVARPA